MGEYLVDRTYDLASLSEDGLRPELSRADGPTHAQTESSPGSRARHPRQVRILPKSRDFH
jgi:error-prone DNA polymerase